MKETEVNDEKVSGAGEYEMDLAASYYIDASVLSSLMRFAQHSTNKRCNLVVRQILVGAEWRLALFATRNIAHGEELAYDYGESFNFDAFFHGSNQANQVYPWGETPDLQSWLREPENRLKLIGLPLPKDNTEKAKARLETALSQEVKESGDYSGFSTISLRTKFHAIFFEQTAVVWANSSSNPDLMVTQELQNSGIDFWSLKQVQVEYQGNSKARILLKKEPCEPITPPLSQDLIQKISNFSEVILPKLKALLFRMEIPKEIADEASMHSMRMVWTEPGQDAPGQLLHTDGGHHIGVFVIQVHHKKQPPTAVYSRQQQRRHRSPQEAIRVLKRIAYFGVSPKVLAALDTLCERSHEDLLNDCYSVRQSQDAVGSVIGFNEFSLHAMRPVSSQAHPEGRMVLLVTLELPTGCADSFDDIQAYPHFAAHLLGDARKLCELAKLHYERKISSHFFGGHYCRKKDSLEAIAEVLKEIEESASRGMAYEAFLREKSEKLCLLFAME